MSNKNINVNVFDLVDYYKVNIRLENKISNIMIVQIILALLFLLILGAIILIVLAIKNNKILFMFFLFKKDNWEFELNKQLLLETFEENTGYIKI